MIDNLKPYPEYKESGVEWIGAIPAHWQMQRAKTFLREVDERSSTGNEELLSVSHKTGVTPRREKKVSMFLAESNVGYKICRPGDVVINTMWAWMAALGVTKCTGIVSPSYGVYRPLRSNQFLLPYLDELLRIPAYRSEYVLRSTGITDSRLRLYPDAFLKIPILCPEPQEQRAIVRFLDHADRLIKKYIRAKQKLIKLLEEQKQAIIHRAVTRGLDPNVKLKPSGVEWLGDVPEHWGVSRFKTLIHRIDQGVSPQAENRSASSDSWGVLKAGCVNGGIFRPEQHKRLPKSFIVDKGMAVSCGDVLISRACGSPSLVGSVGRVIRLEYNLILSDKTFRPVFRLSVDPDFMVCVMNSRYYRRQVEQAISGAEGLASNLPLSELVAFIFAMPPLTEQQMLANHINAATASIRDAAESTASELSLLREYRTRLIADVVTGKLDVRDAAASLPEVLEETEQAADLDETADEELDGAEGAEAEEAEA